MNRGFLARTVAVTLLAAVAAACSSGGTAGPRQSPGPYEGELVSTDNALPTEFPRDLPPPAGSTIIYSAVSSLGSSVYFTTTAGDDAVKAAMLATLEDKGWQLNSCQKLAPSPEPITVIVGSKPGVTASIVIGYSPDYATRIGGKRYSFLISIALTSERPKTTATPC